MRSIICPVVSGLQKINWVPYLADHAHILAVKLAGDNLLRYLPAKIFSQLAPSTNIYSLPPFSFIRSNSRLNLSRPLVKFPQISSTDILRYIATVSAIEKTLPSGNKNLAE